MATVDIDEAKANFSALLQRVEAGEEIVIARSGEPVAKLVRVAPPLPREPRAPGWWEGKIVIHDSFLDPLPDDIMKDFEGRGETTIHLAMAAARPPHRTRTGNDRRLHGRRADP